jgi:hypothetical protein
MKVLRCIFDRFCGGASLIKSGFDFGSLYQFFSAKSPAARGAAALKFSRSHSRTVGQETWKIFPGCVSQVEYE